MAKNSQEFSAQEALRLAKTPEGQQMLRKLEKMDRGKLQQIAQAASSGDLQSAQQMLQAMLNREKE